MEGGGLEMDAVGLNRCGCIGKGEVVGGNGWLELWYT